MATGHPANRGGEQGEETEDVQDDFLSHTVEIPGLTAGSPGVEIMHVT